MDGMSNPLLDFKDLPLFDQVRPEHVAPAMDATAGPARTRRWRPLPQPDFPADWDAIAKVLDVATEQLGRAWGMVSHLNAVADTPELRAAYNEALPRVTEFWTRLGADERLYAKYKAIDPGDAERRAAPGAQERHAQLRPVRRRTDRARPRSASPQSRSGRPS